MQKIGLQIEYIDSIKSKGDDYTEVIMRDGTTHFVSDSMVEVITKIKISLDHQGASEEGF